MSFLTDQEIQEKYPVTDGDISIWLRQKRLKNTPANRALATRQIVAAKASKTLGKDVASLEAAGNWSVIYGETRVGGTITFAHVNNNNQMLHLVVTIAGHEIESVEKIYLDGQEVLFGASPDPNWSTGIKDLKTNQTRDAYYKVYRIVNDGNPSNPAIPELVANVPEKWTTLHKQSGRAHVYLVLVWDAVLFPNGLPKISFLVRGKKCYDPRTATTAWTKNSALIIADYLRNTEYGLGAEEAELEYGEGEIGSFWDAADVCDEDVTRIGGGSEDRYTSNGSFEVGQSHQTIIEELCTAIAGSVTYSNGKWKCWPAKWRTPVLNLDENDILSDLKIVTKISRRDSFNAVKGTFVSPLANYEETDFPAVRNSYYKSLDNNEEIFEDIQLPFTQSPATAQRIAKLELERIRQSITVELTATLKALQAEAGENITISWERLGWSEKAFEIQESELVFQDGNGVDALAVRLVLRETAAAVFDWNYGLETYQDIAPNTNLPDPREIPFVYGLTMESGTDQLYVRSDGTVFSRMKVSWDAVSDYFVSSGGYVEIQYRKLGAANWSVATPVPADFDFTHILDVQDGEIYEVKARLKSALGVTGSFTNPTEHTVVGKTEKPSRVDGFMGELGQFGIFLSWTAIPDLDVDYYEIRRGALDDVWEDAQVVGQTAADNIQIDMELAGDHKFFIKAVDTSENYSELATELAMDIDEPSAPVATPTIVGQNLVLSWGASSGSFEIAEYEIRYGDVFASATVEATIKGTSYARKVDWDGARRFWVVGRDVAVNLGTPTAVDLTIAPPGEVQNLSAEVIDNNVLLKWEAPATGSLPVEYYNVYKGAEFATADLVGQVSATFSAFFEIISETYFYWVEPVNTAATEGSAKAVAAVVSEPPDFVILDDQILDPDTGTGVNAYVENDQLFLAVYSAETWEEHFVNNGWTTPEDQINAGYEVYIQPTADYGYWIKEVDLGAVIEASLIKASFVQEDQVGTCTVVTEISYSETGASWTTEEASQVFGQNFRYVRLKLTKGTLPAVSGEGMGVLGLTYP